MNRPLRVMFLTSVRDVGENDRVGDVIPVNAPMYHHEHGGDSQNGSRRYMKGSVEEVVLETKPGGSLHGILEVVGVVYDDMEERDLSSYSLNDTTKLWIHPRSLTLPCGTKVVDCTVNVPSVYRQLPRSDQAERKLQKLHFERSILNHFQSLDADLILSDHYMNIVEWLIGSDADLYGRILNIHPAIIDLDHPWAFRGKTPTADAIAAAAARRPSTTTDDAVAVVVTGATLHLINESIDDGPIVAWCDDVPVFATDDPSTLRYRIYQRAKLPVCVRGLAHYAQTIFPDFSARGGLASCNGSTKGIERLYVSSSSSRD